MGPGTFSLQLLLVLVCYFGTVLSVLTKGSGHSTPTLQEFLFSGGNGPVDGSENNGDGRKIILGVEPYRNRPWQRNTHNGLYGGSGQSYKRYSPSSYANMLGNNRYSFYEAGSSVKPQRWSPLFHVMSSHMPYDEIAFSVDSNFGGPRGKSTQKARPISSYTIDNKGSSPHSSNKQRPPSFLWNKPNLSEHVSSTSATVSASVAHHTPPKHKQQLPSDAPDPQHFVCPDQHSCSDKIWVTKDTSTSLSWQQRGCLCDDHCMRYGDCCRDAPALLANKTEDNTSKNDDSDKKSESEDSPDKEEEEEELMEMEKLIRTERFKCRSVPSISGPKDSSSYPNGESSTTSSYYILQTCPPRYDSYYGRLNCERPPSSSSDPLAAIPATSNSTGITYRNIFCALCHNDTTQLHVWPVSVHCTGLKSYQLAGERLDMSLSRTTTANIWGVTTRSGHVTPCTLVPRPPAEPEPRACVGLEPPRCARGSSVTLLKLCYNHTAVVYSDGRPYKNIYCLLCSAGSRAHSVRGPTPTCRPQCSATAVPFAVGGLRARITFPIGNDSRCGDQELWDPFQQMCRSIVCSRPGDRLLRDECVPAGELEKDENKEMSSDSGGSVRTSDMARSADSADEEKADDTDEPEVPDDSEENRVVTEALPDELEITPASENLTEGSGSDDA